PGLLGACQHDDAHVLSDPVGKHDRPTQLLIRMAHVQSEPEVRLDRLVELRPLEALEQPDRLERGVRTLAIELLARRPVSLPVNGHQTSVSTPMERAVPAMTFIASSTSRAFRSGIFVSAIERSCERHSRPTFARFGSPEPD